MTNYFLDTSALIELHAGRRELRDDLALRLSAGLHSTSTHVRREWVRLVDGTVVEMLNKFAAKPDVRDQMAEMRPGFNRDHSRRITVMSVLAGTDVHLGPEFKLRASAFLRYGSRRLFAQHISRVRDTSGCGLARQRPAEVAAGKFALKTTCLKGDAICRQDRVIDRRRTALAAAGIGLATISTRPGDQKMGKLAIEVAKGKESPKGKNCYARLGDVTIALDCPTDERMLTTDASFTSMAPALGIDVELLRPTVP